MLSRLDILTQSTEDYLAEKLSDWGISGYDLRDFYPDSVANPLSQTVICVGNSQRLNPSSLEIGGPLVEQRSYILIDIFARDEATVQNLVGLITEEAFVTDEHRVPFMDYAQEPPVATDSIRVANCVSHRNNFSNPLPWQKHWHSVLVALGDEYNTSGPNDIILFPESGTPNQTLYIQEADPGPKTYAYIWYELRNDNTLKTVWTFVP